MAKEFNWFEKAKTEPESGQAMEPDTTTPIGDAALRAVLEEQQQQAKEKPEE